MAEVKYVDASCVYPGNPVPAVDRLNLDIKDGEFMVLVGPSGSGKSTALRMLAGLEGVTDGEIRINGADVSQMPPKDRDIAMVFQNYALYPHMSVAENMGFALKLKGLPKAEREAKVAHAAELLDLTPYLARKPKALSGGQRQRVAMGRAIVREPSVFLMDEPLSNLDAKLRVETRANIAALQARLGITTVYVTHDQVEAMTMGHRVAVLKDGVLQQVDTPRNLYDRPRNAFVAGFIGSPAMNLRTVRLDGNGAHLGSVIAPLSERILHAARSAGIDSVTLGIRPESFHVAGDQTGGLKLEVRLVEELGADAYVYGTLAGDAPGEKPLIVRFDGRVPPRIGEIVGVDMRTGEDHAFHPETGERLG
ncbi:ABC transporter ATP-binding protein [Nocardioides marmorisolisilvae]|uniref:sn-glycerol-3-phosphate ABC transporter ATP-binding protein UgpC n=1 Tax=Nocardioides marmorisolisilvae TaxID=1542737 RepID=A0A3N0DPQ4_9ACTN|nr:sn-glycerol-3-phosphate ABC transporter ATP-binding protein UgpC [Nocardioides marmorisolisilvae]RNL77637.1 sn-glycerol-3-phosphate ABC transporter ATP-binding protein UgpC [Nocardioides marmorisolisilvae]